MTDDPLEQGERQKKTHRVKEFWYLVQGVFFVFLKVCFTEDYTSNLEAPTPMSTT